MKDATSKSDNLAISEDVNREADDIKTYGKYTVKSYFIGEEDITDLIISYIDRVASLK